VRARTLLEATDWGKVDWASKTSTLAKELNVAHSSVSRARRLHAPHSVDPATRATHVDHDRPAPVIDWDQVDWAKSTHQLALELNVYDSVVAYQRRRHESRMMRKKMVETKALLEAPPDISRFYNELAPVLTELWNEAQNYKGLDSVLWASPQSRLPELNKIRADHFAKLVNTHPRLKGQVLIRPSSGENRGSFDPKDNLIVLCMYPGLGLESILSTLRHEMVHQAQWLRSSGRNQYGGAHQRSIDKRNHLSKVGVPANAPQALDRANERWNRTYFEDPIEAQAYGAEVGYELDQERPKKNEPTWREKLRYGATATRGGKWYVNATPLAKKRMLKNAYQDLIRREKRSNPERELLRKLANPTYESTARHKLLQLLISGL
jgi:hypothetical protein